MKRRLVVGGLLLAPLFTIAVWYLCAHYFLSSSAAVSDVRSAEILVLGQKAGSHTTHAIKVCGSGEIDGEATISLLLNGEPYKVAKLRGPVNFEWGGDWYCETAEVRYEPANVRSGKVVLRYKFYD
jgi:hypothetical protein